MVCKQKLFTARYISLKTAANFYFFQTFKTLYMITHVKEDKVFMRKSWGKKIITISIIALFVEAGVASANYGNQSIISKPLSVGITLYVGGIGPNNYTKIQDAIDNASDGDAVFVYDDSSPYYEHVNITKSIDLWGENKNTTTIDGYNNNYPAIYIQTTGNLSIHGFTIMNSSIGIFQGSDYIPAELYIHDNILTDLQSGLLCNGMGTSGIRIDVQRNEIKENEIGLEIIQEIFNSDISGNRISNNSVGIKFYHASFLTLEFNIITNNSKGIYLEASQLIMITKNSFMNNDYGIYLENTSITNDITQNDFIKNGWNRHAFFNKCAKNKWDRNYWDNWMGLKSPLFSWSPYIIVGRYGPLPWLNFDWYPAGQPYNISLPW
jgi:parallel beta-helix repeat protein